MPVWHERAVNAREWIRGPRGLWATGIVVVLLLMLWLMPQRVSRLVTIDGQDFGQAPAGSPTRKVGWEPAAPVDVAAFMMRHVDGGGGEDVNEEDDD